MIIAIASGKGGTGKTFIATNIFYSLVRDDCNAILVDCDAEAPNAVAFFNARQINCDIITQQVPVIDTVACTFCGRCHEYCHYNALFILPKAGVIKVLEELCHACGACSVACEFEAITEKPYEVGRVTTYSFNGKPRLIEARTDVGVMSPVTVIKSAINQAKKASQIIILDAPPGTSCPFIHTISAADFVVLVAEPTPFGLSDLRRSVVVLRQLNKPFGVIINRSGLGNNAVNQYLEEECIELLLDIPYDKEIARLCSEGKIVAKYRADILRKLGITVGFIINESWKQL